MDLMEVAVAVHHSRFESLEAVVHHIHFVVEEVVEMGSLVQLELLAAVEHKDHSSVVWLRKNRVAVDLRIAVLAGNHSVVDFASPTMAPQTPMHKAQLLKVPSSRLKLISIETFQSTVSRCTST